MNLGMSVRAELFRARRMKLAVIIALMYLGIAGIYVFAGSGAWVSAGGEGQFFGFSADPGYLFSIGVGPTGCDERVGKGSFDCSGLPQLAAVCGKDIGLRSVYAVPLHRVYSRCRCGLCRVLRKRSRQPYGW